MTRTVSKWMRRRSNHLNNPKQIRPKYHKAVSVIGRIGFVTKAFIYATIGALTIQSTFTSKLHNESPQGVFILMGSLPSGTGHVLLIALLCGVIIYCTWRFWEGITGQGYDPRFSRKKNFFRYRLSPIASGGVYMMYAAYIIYLFTLTPNPPGESLQQNGSCFPICWKNSVIGMIGLGILAVAFSIATLTQLIPAFSGNFRKEMDHSKFGNSIVGRIWRGIFLASGHIGFLARALLFFLVCFLFWNVLLTDNLKLNPKESTVGQAINALHNHSWTRVIMAILGIGLVIYGCFAVLCAYYKIFPTPPPSTNVTDDNNSILPIHSNTQEDIEMTPPPRSQSEDNPT